VSWVFDRRGSIIVDAGKHGEDEVMTAALDSGADDVVLDGSSFQIVTEPSDLHAVRDALLAAGIELEAAELTMIPKSTVTLDEADARRVLRLVDALEDSDDVQEVYANFDIPEDVLEAAAG
jgi:transcriptional/translational regulatory protein YebC/TACO1